MKWDGTMIESDTPFTREIYGENAVINGCIATLVNLPHKSVWCRVIKKDINLIMFMEHIKNHFGLRQRGYHTIQVYRSVHILFFMGHEDHPTDVVYSKNAFLGEKCLEQMRRILLFRELFSIGKTSENSIVIRNGNLISIEEHCNHILSPRVVVMSPTSQRMYNQWIKPFTYKEILVDVVMDKDESVVEFIGRTMDMFNSFESDANTSLVINHFQRRIVELAVTR